MAASPIDEARNRLNLLILIRYGTSALGRAGYFCALARSALISASRFAR